ncbi:MAG: NAD(P)/FAD-dependent oxidoreductase [Dehalococcoidia bacterium]|nr:MAG: NAD(P)/FAD-dependent oxidoreductase [Dehalococcoidia bacterium]
MADITIIGAGVIGLAVAAEVANDKRQVYVLERNATLGQEISSRHSGIIHAGIYYPQDSLKAKLCVTGNRLLYALCQQSSIGYAKLGKLVVATTEKEIEELEALMEKGIRNGVLGLQMLSGKALKQLEPNVEGKAAVLSPETGIIDSHALMNYYTAKARSNQAQIIYLTQVIGIERITDGYRVEVQDSDGGFSFITRALVNCAGLNSDNLAGLAGIDIDDVGYRLHYCKGEYFSITEAKRGMIKRLIFPVPPVGVAGVGIHVVFDLDGRIRLGPSIEYVDEIDYTVAEGHKRFFYDEVKRFLPFIELDDLQPEMAGVRPKIQGPNEDIRDFVIRDEWDRGLPGLINLVGIESPGLTAAPAIARFVATLIDQAITG